MLRNVLLCAVLYIAGIVVLAQFTSTLKLAYALLAASPLVAAVGVYIMAHAVKFEIPNFEGLDVTDLEEVNNGFDMPAMQG